MTLPFPEHPLRQAVTAELHARTFDPLRAPARAAHLAYICGERGTGRQVAHLKRLLAHYGASVPADPGQQYAADLGGMRLRWERHTEFVTYTFTRMGPFDEPFAQSLLDGLPSVWLRDLPGEVVTAVLLALESRDMPERSLAELIALFDGHQVVGAEVTGGAGRAWSDLQIHPDGYSHVLLRDAGLSEAQAGRLVKRVLEIKAYRAMALLGLPVAREAAGPLSDAERRLTEAAQQLADTNARNGEVIAAAPTAADAAADSAQSIPTERLLLAELTALAAEIESVAAKTASRFDASQAYYQVVKQRLEQLRQERIQGLQTLTEFLDARLAPAISTCAATAHRQESLAERAARLTALLRARVEVGLQEQNRALLDSMDRRARVQLRLQETVEGLSIVAISYYGVGLVGYGLKGLYASGLPIDPSLGAGIAVPFVLGTVWLGLQRMRRRLRRDVGHGETGGGH